MNFPDPMPMVRSAIAKALADKSGQDIRGYARDRWGVTKAAEVGAISTFDESGLLPDAEISFFEAVREQSIIGRVGARSIPFNTRALTPTSSVTANWTKEGSAKGVSRTAFDQVNLPPRKVAAITIATEEILAHPAAEAWLREDMVRSVVDAMDLALIDPSNSGDGDTPASIADSVTPFMATAAPTETDIVIVDMQDFVDSFSGDLTSASLVMHPSTAMRLAGVYDSAGLNGDVAGIRIVSSRVAPKTHIVLIDGSGIAMAGGGVRVSVSRQGTVELLDEPTATATDTASPPNPAPAQSVSLWQTNSVGFLVEVSANWERVRAGSVAVMDVSPWLRTGSPE